MQQRNSFFFLRMTLSPISTHQHMRLGRKEFRRSEDTGQTFPKDSNPHCDRDLQDSKSDCSHSTPGRFMAMHQHTKVGCRRVTSSEGMGAVSFWGFWRFTLTLTLKVPSQPFSMTLAFMMMCHHSKFGRKRFSGSKDIMQTKYICDGPTDAGDSNQCQYTPPPPPPNPHLLPPHSA